MTSTVNSIATPRSLNLVGVDLAAVKARQQSTWASGDFSVIGTTLQLVGETLCESAELEAGMRVIDVACGNGNAALAAARRFCHVVGLDYVPMVVERARERAAAERLPVDFVVGDAEQLPFPAESFDAALSTFGVMFAPDQERTARELSRVVKRGGKIALANWTPEGFVGRLLVTVGKHVPPPPGVASPAYWGNETRLRELFPDVARLRVLRRDFVFRYESFQHFIDVFREYYGPIKKAFAALDGQGQAALFEDLRKLADTFKSPTQGTSLAISGEYLEAVIER
ncbi:MAG TPA: class I SAM-dependent methyltransferase [Polyangiaceae bacterium]|nr:class I SAM-dependent methyltransferase [Polyangiaceae bacterium]